MFSCPKIEVAFSFTVISNVEIITQTFVNKLGTKFLGIAALKLKKVT